MKKASSNGHNGDEQDYYTGDLDGELVKTIGMLVEGYTKFNGQPPMSQVPTRQIVVAQSAPQPITIQVPAQITPEGLEAAIQKALALAKDEPADRPIIINVAPSPAPNVTIENKVQTPNVFNRVEPTPVNVVNKVEPTPVTIENKVESKAPTVINQVPNAPAPTIVNQIPSAPAPTIINKMPKQDVPTVVNQIPAQPAPTVINQTPDETDIETTQQIIRNDKGEIDRTVTRKKRVK